ncbi:hypothetical protein NOX90_04580 [Wolbachia endosymbiont of Anurida maritima]|uniref:hypothetical protein n=1 Tax=Wolbachia endosymbiont of Anurida maritima TaxID=2850562 RepID=UPI0035D084B1
MKQNMHNNFECDLYIQLSSKCTSSLSSQCVTLGSRYRSVCKSYNLQGILGTYVKNNVYDEIGWIPVSRTGMTSKSEVLVFHSNNGYA